MFVTTRFMLDFDKISSFWTVLASGVGSHKSIVTNQDNIQLMFAVAVPWSSQHMLRHHVSLVALEVHCRSLAGTARSPRCRTCTGTPLGNRSLGQGHSPLPWRSDLHRSRTTGPAVHLPQLRARCQVYGPPEGLHVHMHHI